ncbi:membrane protein insertase YidC [Rhodovarius crocodyli]|uniref:Membrane protein insertase YidC n=1 Tax=Rhodovarius crocodyli TaxID=1979269 RepID=A0A437MEW7_9PROT|nr:membrane protein insertase YidC [Rhodovarius crocodyli]RVT96173.1 membrane protein insertase YidC [Rhodovarius crocodyli]
MDQKRLLAAIAISVGIMLVFDVWNRTHAPTPAPQTTASAPATPSAPPAPTTAATPGDTVASTATPRAEAQRVQIENPRVSGSVSARGLMLDTLILTTYRETVQPGSLPVQLLAPRGRPEGYFAQWGWTAADGRTRVPDSDTDFTVTGGPLAPGRDVTFTWENGQGLTFRAVMSLDENYMVTVRQSVQNAGTEQVSVLPWARIRRERTPHVAGYYVLHEGYVGVLNGRLTEITYANGKKEGEGRAGLASQVESPDGWAGFTDKYWLTALMPADNGTRLTHALRHVTDSGTDRWQADMAPPAAQQIAPGATGELATRLFAGAKEVALLDSYQSRLNIRDFDKAVDFGWFYFITKPFFYAIDWLFHATGNFGISILVFTFALKLAFFPLANRAYHSMAKMKALGPKMQELKERYKDDPTNLQKEMMGLYKAEKVNPASGCLPILLQIPVFFSLYKVLFVTIEMRHAPFFGWIRDLSAPDPTNLFTAFGLIPWDAPAFLHMPAWALIMGVTMFIQQKLNPQPPDPIQAKIFAWMPVIFTFMLASFPAGLIIYWAWNNLLSVAQQWWIMRGDRAKKSAAA